MKRGLKGAGKPMNIRATQVTIVSPMKRGLKDLTGHPNVRFAFSYNRFPDEKGTESFGSVKSLLTELGVTIVSPMKRGLKDQYETTPENVLALVTIVSPMKRGLKGEYVKLAVENEQLLQSFPR